MPFENTTDTSGSLGKVLTTIGVHKFSTSQFLRFRVIFLFCLPASLSAWEGKVFEVKGKEVIVYSPDTSPVRSGAKLYVLRAGKILGEGNASKILHSNVHLRLSSGTAAKGDVVSTTKPMVKTETPPKPTKIAAVEKPAKPVSSKPAAPAKTTANLGILDAAENGDLAAVEAAVRAGQSVQTTDDYLRTPLSNAAKNGHVEVAKYLLRMNAAVNSRNKQGETPLMLASRFGHLAVVQVLLANRADPAAVDSTGWTALKLAELGKHPQVVQALKAALR